MKKQILSMLLLFVFVVGLGTPAAAYIEEENVCGLIELPADEEVFYLRDLEITELDDIVFSSDMEAKEKDDVTDASRARTPDLYLEQMIVYPMVRVIDDTTNERWVLDLTELGEFETYGSSQGYPQFGRMSFTHNKFLTIYNKISTVVDKYQLFVGKHIYFEGWCVIGNYRYAGQKQLYFEYKGEKNCVDTTNPIRETVSAPSGTHAVIRLFTVPDYNYDAYYTEDISGGFYFTSDGKQLSAGLGVTLVVNSDKRS